MGLPGVKADASHDFVVVAFDVYNNDIDGGQAALGNDLIKRAAWHVDRRDERGSTGKRGNGLFHLCAIERAHTAGPHGKVSALDGVDVEQAHRPCFVVDGHVHRLNGQTVIVLLQRSVERRNRLDGHTVPSIPSGMVVHMVGHHAVVRTYKHEGLRSALADDALEVVKDHPFTAYRRRQGTIEPA